jgi:hypothetical protein
MSEVLAKAFADPPPLAVVVAAESLVVGAPAVVDGEPDPDGVLVPQAATPRPAARTVVPTAVSRISFRRLSWLSIVYRNSFAVGQVTIAESIAGRL